MSSTLNQTDSKRAGLDALAGDDAAACSLGLLRAASANLAGGAPAASGRSFPRFPCPPRCKLTQEKTEQLWIMREQGVPFETIAKILGSAPAALHLRAKRLRAAGFDFPTGDNSLKERVANATQSRAAAAAKLPGMYAELGSMRKVAAELGMSEKWVWSVVKEHKVALPKKPKAVTSKPMGVGAIIRLGSLGAQQKPLPSYVAECEDRRVRIAWQLLEQGVEEWMVRERSNLPLHQVYRLKREVLGGLAR